MKKEQDVSRRRVLKAGTLAAASAPLFAGLPASSLANLQGSNDTIRLAWIGVGGRGSSLLGRALTAASESNIKVGAICDIDKNAADRAIKACGAMKPQGYTYYRDVLDRKDIDAVFVATPIYLHAEHASAVLAAGKHLYCEKPLGRTPEEVKIVRDAVKKSGKKFQVGFQWRYHAGFLGLVKHVQGDSLGRVTFVHGARHVSGYPNSGWYADRSLSGDLIVEQAVHEMNVFCWMLDAAPSAAAGFGGINALEAPNRTIMDSYAVTYEFPGNIRLNYSHIVYVPGSFSGLHTTVIGESHRACSLIGTTKLEYLEGNEKKSMDLILKKDATQAAIESFVDCVRNDKEPLANIEAGRRATLMAIMGRTAIHERRVVEWKEVALEG